MKLYKDYIEFPFFYTEAILNTSIEELNLSVRASNGLKHSNIKTLGQIIDNWNTLGAIGNFGAKSVKEVKSALFNYNIERLDEEQLLRFLELFRYRKGIERYER